VVEYQVSVQETASLLDGGDVRRVTIYDGLPTQRVHIIVDAAGSASLKTSARLISDSAIHRTESSAGTNVELELGPVLPKKDHEFSLPYDMAEFPVFEFSTAQSWQHTAQRYEAIVDEQIVNAALGSLSPAPNAGDTPREMAARMTAALHKQIRYTGVEFGDAAIVPRMPAEVIGRGYGDCKDKAALLVAMLRASGLKAYVALLSAGFSLDVNPELPGIARFNHAIVYVDAAEPFWIDATASDTRVGDLPAGDQGRLALIAGGGHDRLMKTPESRSADNRLVDTVEIRLPDSGPAEIRETMEGTGTRASALRAYYGVSESAELKK
jgi:hypothetical protein